jgi:hypothetical protein
MIKEFIPYEQALALKELGFDDPCLATIDQTDFIHIKGTEYPIRGAMIYDTIDCPTYSQAFRWFREKYNLVFNFISYNIVKPGEYHWSITWNDEAKASGIVKTYEEAELACLKKLIDIVERKYA